MARFGLGWILLTGCVATQTPPPAVAPDDDRVLPLLQALSDPDLDVRAGAEAELRRLAASVEPTLRAWTGHADPEVAGRCRDLLQELDETRHRPVGRVVSLHAERGYLHLDPVRGRSFLPGERFELLRGKSWVATAEFDHFVDRPALARMTIVDGDAGGLQEYEVSVVPGGIEIRREAQAAPVEASIFLISDEHAQLVIGLRKRDGVQVGDLCDVTRGGLRVGQVIVTKVCECTSDALPFGATKLEDLRRGDRIARRG